MMRRFYAPPGSFTDSEITLDEGETRHLRDVLRISAGDIVSVFDGEGREFVCTVMAVTKHSATLAIAEEIAPAAPESPLAVTVAAAVTPAEKFDLVVQKAVELGVRDLVPLITLRTEVKAKAAAARLDRWRKIGFEASKQCGRARLMRVHEPVSFADLWNEDRGPVVFFSERDGQRFEQLPITDRVTVVYGPKGGWDDVELESAAAHDAFVVTFGGRVLRAETAAIALTAILQHRFGDMN